MLLQQLLQQLHRHPPRSDPAESSTHVHELSTRLPSSNTIGIHETAGGDPPRSQPEVNARLGLVEPGQPNDRSGL
ncbi:MAG: hypothetical protein ACP5O0_06215 [Acidimicrobiales bacterium]